MDDKVKAIPLEDRTFDTHDEYQRQPVAKKVIRLLTSDIDVSPMVIDGGWGVGKSEFCHKLIKLFQQQHDNYRVIYVDAFKADHGNEPLLTLLAAVAQELPSAQRNALIKKAVPAAKFALKTGLKAGVGWVLRQDAIELGDEFERTVQKAGDEAVNMAVESLLKEHVEASRSIATLREALMKLAEKKPIVIFVDELDRCRPDFAVSMLESIKHVFDVDGVQFVLVTNTNQLRASINHCYGAEVDAQRYLDKFIGFAFQLPMDFRHQGHGQLEAAVSHFHRESMQSALLSRSVVGKKSEVMEFAYELIRAGNRSLREVMTLVKYLDIYQSVTGDRGLADNLKPGYAMLRIFGVYLFCFFPHIVRDLRRGVIDAEAIAQVLGKIRVRKTNERHGDHSETIIGMVALTATKNKQRFEIEGGEEQERWRVRIKQFMDDHWGDGNYFDEVKKVFLALEMGATE